MASTGCPHQDQQPPHPGNRPTPTRDRPAHQDGTCLLSQTPNRMLQPHQPHQPPRSPPTPTGRPTQAHPRKQVVLDRSPAAVSSELASVSTHEQPHPHPRRVGALATLRWQALLRKEVIQPHLPVRLPCYDFVPIASPTFDGSLPQRGWATGFGCCRLS
jgi:hypothetical protein